MLSNPYYVKNYGGIIDSSLLTKLSLAPRIYYKATYTAVGELYSLGFNHGDLRFINICFNELFEPVLIDLDRASSVVSDRNYGKDIQTIANKILIHYEKSTRLLRYMKAGQDDEFLNLMINKGIWKSFWKIFYYEVWCNYKKCIDQEDFTLTIIIMYIDRHHHILIVISLKQLGLYTAFIPR